MLALIGPGSSGTLYLALRRGGLEELVGRSLQIWLVGSTVVATTLFVLVVWKKAKRDILRGKRILL